MKEVYISEQGSDIGCGATVEPVKTFGAALEKLDDKANLRLTIVRKGLGYDLIKIDNLRSKK